VAHPVTHENIEHDVPPALNGKPETGNAIFGTDRY